MHLDRTIIDVRSNGAPDDLPSRTALLLLLLWLPFPGCGTGHIDLFPETVESGRMTDAPAADATADQSSDGRDRDHDAGAAAPDTSAEEAASDQAVDVVSTDQITDATSGVEAGDVASDKSEGGLTGTCQSDTDCRASGLSRCQPLLRICVQCVGDPDCAGQSESKCDQATSTCTAPCKIDRDCPSPDVCDTSQGACADCLTDTHCAGTSLPRCAAHECVQCITAQDCMASMQCWQQTCVACVTNADCQPPAVCAANHVCH